MIYVWLALCVSVSFISGLVTVALIKGLYDKLDDTKNELKSQIKDLKPQYDWDDFK